MCDADPCKVQSLQKRFLEKLDNEIVEKENLLFLHYSEGLLFILKLNLRET